MTIVYRCSSNFGFAQNKNDDKLIFTTIHKMFIARMRMFVCVCVRVGILCEIAFPVGYFSEKIDR